jgi:hypothetical protein
VRPGLTFAHIRQDLGVAKGAERQMSVGDLIRAARSFMDEAEQGLVSFLPDVPDGSSRRILRTASNIRVLCPPEDAEHYELQLLEGPNGLRIEVGFHAEHRSAERNDAALAVLEAAAARWRPELGDEVQLGPFLGRPRPWRRASEVWDDTAGFEDGVAVEAAERLAHYIEVFEPIRADARAAAAKAARTAAADEADR